MGERAIPTCSSAIVTNETNGRSPAPRMRSATGLLARSVSDTTADGRTAGSRSTETTIVGVVLIASKTLDLGEQSTVVWICGDLVEPTIEIVDLGLDRKNPGDRMTPPGEHHLDASFDGIDHRLRVIAQISIATRIPTP